MRETRTFFAPDGIRVAALIARRVWRAFSWRQRELAQALRYTPGVYTEPAGFDPRFDDNKVIERILRHLKLWPEQAEPPCLCRAPPSTPPHDGIERIIEPFHDDPFPDDDTEPVNASTKIRSWVTK
jgi:hypothetical protein